MYFKEEHLLEQILKTTYSANNDLKTQRNTATRKSKKIHKNQTQTWIITKDLKIKDNLKEADKECLYHLHIMGGEGL